MNIQKMIRVYESPIIKINSTDWRVVVWDGGEIIVEFKPCYQERDKRGLKGWWPIEHYSMMMKRKLPKKANELIGYFEQQINIAIGLPDPIYELPLFKT